MQKPSKPTATKGAKGATKRKLSQQEIGEEYESFTAKRAAASKTWKLQFNKITLSEKQHEFYKKIMANDITFGYGVAGSSKTFTSCYAALKMLEKGEVEKIILTKPIQESGEKLGFLPGDISEKTDPYLESFYGNMEKIISPIDLGNYIKAGKIVFKPLAYMRGISLDNCVMLLDEAQNCDFRQLQLYVSRMGKNTRVVITGDVSQYDIDFNKVALPGYINMIADVPGVGVHMFEKSDIVRNEILIAITERYEDWKVRKLMTESKK